MKKSVVLLFFTLATLSVANLKADIIADWNFQTSTSTNVLFPALGTHTTITNIPSDIGSGLLAGTHASASTVFSTPSGNGSSNSVSANTWTVGDYYQFETSSSGYTNINISFGQVGSGTGPGGFSLQYSTDGTTYTTFTSYTLPSSVTSWNPNTSNSLSAFSFDLSSVTSLADTASIYFRLVDNSTVSVSGGAVGTAGSDRVDDVIIGGTSLSAVPEPSTLILATVGGVACLFAIRRRR